MSVIAWVLLGLIAGFLVGKVASSGGRTSTDIVFGAVGGVLGGVAFHLLDSAPGSGMELWSYVLPVVGAVVMLVVYKSIVWLGAST
jgi:uncharacterized membrane protein YeaQ/YmgE (transglycosylase-associated protein family)